MDTLPKLKKHVVLVFTYTVYHREVEPSKEVMKCRLRKCSKGFILLSWIKIIAKNEKKNMNIQEQF